MTKEEQISDKESHWAAFIAVDWADREHVWKLQVAESGHCEQCKLEQTPEAIEVWASHLAARFAGRPIAVALEQSRGAVVFTLIKYSHLYLYPVHPSTLAPFGRPRSLQARKMTRAIPVCFWNYCCITGLGSAVAVRSLAYKWIRILFRCWKDRAPCVEALHLAALTRRASPTPVPQTPTVDLHWKKVAGFLKISAASS
ncbi:MAG TPA: hypothetical protein VHZ55_30300 [Bryobacteraceae bacterium]|nr:hypothetical protein [Bryobacteraceae bacterium]